MLPSYITFSLARVSIDPSLNWVEGEEDPLISSLREECLYRIKSEECSGFRALRSSSYLRGDLVRRIKEASRDLYILSPPKIMFEAYSFGMLSYRLTFVAKPLSSPLIPWKRAAMEMREILEGMSGPRGRFSSQFFSEIFPHYEMDVNPRLLRIKWDEIEEELSIDADEMISALKLTSSPHKSELIFAPGPIYLSKDGVLAPSIYSKLGKGKRRNLHSSRRKWRRIIRLAVDLALGLKVFLENETLWFHDIEGLWGARVGLIYLSPRVQRSLWIYRGRRFLKLYEALLDSMDLEEKFERYEKVGFPFLDELQLSSFLRTLVMLGGREPEVRAYGIGDLELDALKLIVLKDLLDRALLSLDERKLAAVARYLCNYLRDPSRIMISLDEPSHGCERDFYRDIVSRRDRRGLTLRELSHLLREKYGRRAEVDTVKAGPRAGRGVSKLVELGAVILARTRRGRARKAGGRTLKGFEVSYLLPNYDEYFVRKLSEILMEEVSSVSEEILKRCRE
jgi:hypothetical protein